MLGSTRLAPTWSAGGAGALEGVLGDEAVHAAQRLGLALAVHREHAQPVLLVLGQAAHLHLAVRGGGAAAGHPAVTVTLHIVILKIFLRQFSYESKSPKMVI